MTTWTSILKAMRNLPVMINMITVLMQDIKLAPSTNERNKHSMLYKNHKANSSAPVRLRPRTSVMNREFRGISISAARVPFFFFLADLPVALRHWQMQQKEKK